MTGGPFDWDNSPLCIGPDDGARLLDNVQAFLSKFVAFPSKHALHAVSLWVAHAHLVDAMESTPRLALLSPEPASGKTRTLEVLELLVPKPMHALNGSPAPIFRSIEADRPTLLMDEVDAIFGRSVKSDDPAADLRALLNAGHRKGATIPRCVGPKHDVVQFPVFAAVALAGLGDLPDTLMSRSLIVRMRRRGPGERVEPFRHRLHKVEGHALRDRLAAWAETVAETVGAAWPDLPDGITDRAADCWEPLLAVADAAGGSWTTTARGACVEMCRVAGRDASLGIRLLADLHAMFNDEKRPFIGRRFIGSTELVTGLREIAESPWDDYGLTVRKLALRLGRFDIHPTTNNANTMRGYKVEHFADAFARYLPSTSVQVSGAPETPPNPPDACERGGRLQVSEDLQASGENPRNAEPADAWTLTDAPGEGDGDEPPDSADPAPVADARKPSAHPLEALGTLDSPERRALLPADLADLAATSGDERATGQASAGCPTHPDFPPTTDGRCGACILASLQAAREANPRLYECPTCHTSTTPQQRGDVWHQSLCESCTAADLNTKVAP